MKRVFVITVFTISVLSQSCKSKYPEGSYVCDLSERKGDSTVKHRSYDETFLDLTCVFQEFDFKNDSIVLFRINDTQVETAYSLKNNLIKIKPDSCNFLLKIIDAKTLQGEGTMKGTYRKK